MKTKKPGNQQPEPEQSSAFRRAMADTVPLKPSGKHHHVKKPGPPGPRMREADDAEVMANLLEPPQDWLDDFDLQSGEELGYRYNGVQISTLRKLRRGHYRIEAELDLHGCTVNTAKPALAEFLRDCANQGYRCVRIIHGKGRGSGQRGPVLKARVDYWLRQREDVMAFCSARPVDGGTGAVYVLLRRSRH